LIQINRDYTVMTFTFGLSRYGLLLILLNILFLSFYAYSLYSRSKAKTLDFVSTKVSKSIDRSVSDVLATTNRKSEVTAIIFGSQKSLAKYKEAYPSESSQQVIGISKRTGKVQAISGKFDVPPKAIAPVNSCAGATVVYDGKKSHVYSWIVDPHTLESELTRHEQ